MPETLSTPPPPPVAKEEDDLDLKIQLADVSQGVTSNAIDAAEEYINGRTNERGVRTILRKIWHGNIARDYYRQRQIRRGRQEIIETGNIYALDEGSQADHDQAMAAVVERFTSDHLHDGEANRDLETVSHGQELMDQIRALVSEYARGAIDYDALIEERTRIVSEFGQQAHDQDRNRGLMYADNILEVAANARTAFEHGLALERIDAALSAQIGEARVGVRTEQRREATDRALDWLHSHRITMVNEATIGAAVGIAIGLAKWTTKKIATTTTAALSLGVGAGLIAGLREHHRVGQERQLHLRQRAEGQEMPGSQARRREQFENTRYETVSAEQLSSEIQNSLDNLDPDNPATLQTLLGNISHARARISMSDEQGMDLIEYSSKTSVEQERLDLDILLAQASETLQQALNRTDPNADVDQLVSANLDVINDHLESDIQQKDRAFRSLRIRRVLKMAAIAFVAGETIGLAAQELHSLADDGLRGVFEGGGGDRQSLLAGLSNGDGHSPNHTLQHVHREYFEGGHHMHDVAVDLPPGYHLVQANPGQEFGWEIQGPDGKNVLDKLNLHDLFNKNDPNPNHIHHLRPEHLGIGFDKQGNIDHDGRLALDKIGLQLRQHQLSYNWHHNAAHHITLNPHDYLAHHSGPRHPGEFMRVHRELWYDNNTPMYRGPDGQLHGADLNELRGYWGGTDGTGLDQHGNYVFNAGHMYQGGSFHGAESANPPELIQEGRLYVALSLSKDTQHYAHLLPIGEDGNVVIPKGSFDAQAMFETVNGHAQFRGGFLEVVQVTGHTPDHGVSMRMLATLPGTNSPNSIVETVQKSIPYINTHFVTSLEVPPQGAIPIEVPPILPIYSRRGLEALNQPEKSDGYGYYGYGSPERLRQWEGQRSPRLRENPNIDLNTGDELSWYREQLSKRRGQEYLQEIDGNVEADSVLSSLGSETKALVCIPVAAAHESENIYNSLSLYAQQSAESKAATAIVLNLNWFESLESDPDQVAKINKTRSEVKRAQKDFPDLRVAVFEKKWKDNFIAEREGKIYGEVIKILYDTAALSVEKAIREGRRPADQEALLITNDADTEGIRRDYLGRYISSMENNPTVDVFAGLVRGDTKQFRDYPGFGVTNGIYYVMDMMHYREEKRKGTNGISTPGANSAFRLSAFAAVGGCEDRNDQGVGADAQLGRKVQAGRRISTRREGYGRPYGYPRGAASSPESEPTKRLVTLHVNGAQIDSMGDRLLGAYRNGKFIAAAWNDFDEGGYQDREAGNTGTDKENPTADIDTIAARIETNVSGFATNWYPDPVAVSSALALYFGTKDKGGNPLYTTQWRGGKLSFKFTAAGKENLRKALLRDTKGRFDPYGRRVRRRLYNELVPGTTRRLRVATPRFVAHTT